MIWDTPQKEAIEKKRKYFVVNHNSIGIYREPVNALDFRYKEFVAYTDNDTEGWVVVKNRYEGTMGETYRDLKELITYVSDFALGSQLELWNREA